MKVGIVYTVTTPELTEVINGELRNRLGETAEIMNYRDETILQEVGERGFVTANAAAKLIALFMQAIMDGTEAILNCCSSVGEVADAAQDIARYTGIPIVRIDEEMCREAVRLGHRIGILATLPTTLEPTKNTVRRVAREMNRQVTVVDGLVENGFGADRDVFRQLLWNKAKELMDQVDVILLAQGSMAYAEGYLSERLQMPVLSSPRFGVAALAKALESKGSIS